VRLTEDIRLASLKDISAMKLNAIAGRGSKKDFIDIYYLLNTFTIEQMIQFYLHKYQDGSEFMVRKSLTYFEEANKELSPILFNEISWENIKNHILNCV
jgi:predicted nucleotidyltransferase component of viral defense system